MVISNDTNQSQFTNTPPAGRLCCSTICPPRTTQGPWNRRLDNIGPEAQLPSLLNSFFNKWHGATQRPTDKTAVTYFSNKRKEQPEEHVLRGQSTFYRIRWTQLKNKGQKAFGQEGIIWTISEIKPLCCLNAQSWQVLFSPWTGRKII